MSDFQVLFSYSRSPLHLDFLEETPATLQSDSRHVKHAADPENDRQA